MLEPVVSPRPSVVALAASLLLLGACQPEDTAPSPAAAPVETRTPVVAAAPVPVLDRAAILQAMDAAASGYAGGQQAGDTSLTGRRFVVRQSFGCAGPSTDAAIGDGRAGWAWADGGKALKLTMAPGDWLASPQIADGAENWEAAEGFWLTRPWMRAEGCPFRRNTIATVSPLSASPQAVGLVAVFTEDASRMGRRNGRAYEFTVRGEGDQPPVAPADGYRLVLEGRMAAFADGRAIRCRADGPDQRPVCIGAVRLDRVAFEDGKGAVLSEWRAG